MNDTIVLNLLEKQEKADIIEKVMDNPHLLEALFRGISSKDPRIRFGSAKTLRIISEKYPRKLYPSMDFFVTLLDSSNTILKWVAMDIIANLTAVDKSNEFNRLFDKFYGCLYEGSLITAGHVVNNSGRIALAKPELQGKITEQLLKADEVPVPTDECRNILIGKAIAAFDVCFNQIEDKDKVMSFVKRQLSNSRNATRTKAEKFLRKFERS